MQVAKTNLEIGHHVEYCELLVRQTRTQMFPAEKSYFNLVPRMIQTSSSAKCFASSTSSSSSRIAILQKNNER